MTSTRTFTIWFNIYLDDAPADIAAGTSNVLAAGSVARALGHTFEEHEQELRNTRDFGYTAPLSEFRRATAALAVAKAFNGNTVYAVYVDEDLASVDPAASAEVDRVAAQYDLMVSSY